MYIFSLSSKNIESVANLRVSGRWLEIHFITSKIKHIRYRKITFSQIYYYLSIISLDVLSFTEINFVILAMLLFSIIDEINASE